MRTMLIKWRKQCCPFDVFRKINRLKMALIIVFLFLFTHTGAQQSQLEGPENTLSVVGSNVSLKCASPSRNCRGIDWQKYTSGASPTTVFRDGVGIYNDYKDRYSVDNSSGCDLVINNVKLTDAGRFVWTAIISTSTITKSAYLIVLKTEPKCMINASQENTVEGDGVRLTCEVTYNAMNRALMAWKGVNDAPAAVENGKNISLSYSFNAFVPQIAPFTCTTSFEVKDDGTKIEGLASNIPVTTCETSAIKVLYSVRDVTLSSSLSNYAPGSTITCTAKGHPTPTFKWQEMGNDVTWLDIQNGSEFTMNDASSKRYRCFAMNFVRNKSYNAASPEFQVNNTGADDNGSVTDETAQVTTPLPLTLIASIAAGVGVGILLLIIVLVICFCTRCCPGYKCCHSEKKSMDKIREEQLLTENPDIYSNINEVQHGAPTAKPRSAPASEPPKLPQNAPPQAKPRTDNRKAEPTNNYQHEEVTYAELAREDGPRQIAPKYNHEPQETVYAAVGTA